MHTIVKTGIREITISTSDSTSISLQRIADNYDIETVIPAHTIVNSSEVISYNKDGIYFIGVDELVYIDLSVADIYDHIKTDVIDILTSPLNTPSDFKMYDFISLLLLGLHVFGNTSYALLPTSDLPTIDAGFQQLQDSIVRSRLYIELNGSTSQSVNI